MGAVEGVSPEEKAHSLGKARMHLLRRAQWMSKEMGTSGLVRILNSEAWEAPKEVDGQ